MSSDYNPPMGQFWDVHYSNSSSALRKAKRRQDSLGSIDASQFPTIESNQKSHPESQTAHYRKSRPRRTPPYVADSQKRKHSVSIEDLEHQLSVEELERPETPTWDQTAEPKRNREYQGWHLQFTPTQRPAMAVAHPQCREGTEVRFDSRHFNEFPRPEGKRKRCLACGALLGYYRSEVDIYGNGEAYDEGPFCEYGDEREYV
ncbi:uncharacterized protein LY89DRAFT_733149 [Mollisia scopiformis]|uniref:Uncharacterized protein n=1 Tax=Mollisia scopiformis TaxID=149040 RepID=A0A194XAT4_MOLSC|nr:uncharacterized protein LY89DRAFT_733149 [Mollisia scopiformis]KUJ17286.1 hypothetical protein LY89DRAFT_733149 [Mollisia scopiformis]